MTYQELTNSLKLKILSIYKQSYLHKEILVVKSNQKDEMRIPDLYLTVKLRGCVMVIRKLRNGKLAREPSKHYHFSPFVL